VSLSPAWLLSGNVVEYKDSESMAGCHQPAMAVGCLRALLHLLEKHSGTVEWCIFSTWWHMSCPPPGIQLTRASSAAAASSGVMSSPMAFCRADFLRGSVRVVTRFFRPVMPPKTLQETQSRDRSAKCVH
jgi:hypothetical protein